MIPSYGIRVAGRLVREPGCAESDEVVYLKFLKTANQASDRITDKKLLFGFKFLEKKPYGIERLR